MINFNRISVVTTNKTFYITNEANFKDYEPDEEETYFLLNLTLCIKYMAFQKKMRQNIPSQ